MGFGRNVIGSTGRDICVAADIDDIDWKAGGITLDWGVVTAAVSDTTLPDDTVVKAGQKGLRFGQILCRITATEVQVVTVASATGGTFTLAGGVAIAYNAAASAVQAALETIFGAGLVTVTGSAGGPYTVTFDGSLSNVATMTVVDSTTGTGHSVTVSTTNQGAGNVGHYGPYDPAATDGRQNLTRGECFILNRTVLQFNPTGFNVHNADNPAVFDGGPAWKARILMTSGTHSLAAGPTVTEFETAFPRITYVQNK